MFSSITLTPDSVEEAPATSSLPWVWVGFFFVAAYVIEETLFVVLELDEAGVDLVLRLISLAAWIFWLVCVSRFHTLLHQISRQTYSISPAEAVWKHFIPFYNLVWVFRWPDAMSDYINRRERVKMVSGNLLGFFLLISLLFARFVDGGVGLAGTFIVGMYIAAKLREHISLIGGPHQLVPPPPDPRIFSDPASQDFQTTAPVASAEANTTNDPRAVAMGL